MLKLNASTRGQTRHGQGIRGQTVLCRAALVLQKTRTRPNKAKETEYSNRILELLKGCKGRGRAGLSNDEIMSLNEAVEYLESHGGVSEPTLEDELDGKWQLLYTSRPGTASPIQNTFTGVDSFSVYQEVALLDDTARINNIVDFGPSVGYLKVEALANTTSRPLPGFTPRQGAGLPFLGKSFTYPPARSHMRIDFQFDRAAFYFKALPFTLPYPVPFRLVGDEGKGWIDITYMNEDCTFRLSRGNKGTLFVLTKEQSLKVQLMAAVRDGDDERVMDLIPRLAEENPTQAPAQSDLVEGTWRLVWSQQAKDASALQKFGSRQANSFQVIEGDTLQNVVELGPVRILAGAECSAASEDRTQVTIMDAGIYLGPLKVPVPVPGAPNNPGYVDWIYLDNNLRVTRGSKGSLFVHVREEVI